ncbi:MAG: prepilin-type N-terminal cleavage/methylation domain-containing protein [Planctomycetota bacterium]
MHTRTPSPTHRRHLAGFSLVEILVVISIVVLLVGISIPAAIKMLGSAENNQTRSVLNGLASAADSYNIVTEKTVDHTQNRDDFGNTINLDIDGDNVDLTLAYFVFYAGQVPESARLIAIAAKDDLTFQGRPMLNVNEDIVNNNVSLANFGDIQLLDSWDTPIRYAGGVSHSDTFTDDDYLPAHPTAFFASAGPDGEWGAVIRNTNEPDPSVDNDNDGNPDAADNIYSFDLN